MKKEVEFKFWVYPLENQEQVAQFRERVQAAILQVVEDSGLYMGAVTEETDGEEIAN